VEHSNGLLHFEWNAFGLTKYRYTESPFAPRKVFRPFAGRKATIGERSDRRQKPPDDPEVLEI
jgi:hypothetical protein